MSEDPIKTLGDGVKTVKIAAGGATQDVNLTEVAGTATDVDAGAASAGTQRTISASDDPGVTSLASLDTKTPSQGAAATAASVPVNIANDQDVPVQGDTAHDAADSGDPVKVGGHARSTQASAVSVGDRVRAIFNLFGEIVIAGYDWVTGSLRTSESDPIDQRYEYQTLADITDGTDGTYYYYVDMTGYRKSGFQLELDGGSGTITVTVEGSLQADGTAQASATYQDITSDTFGSASFTSTDMLIDNGEKLSLFKFVRLKVVANSGSNDADWTIYSKQLY